VYGFTRIRSGERSDSSVEEDLDGVRPVFRVGQVADREIAVKLVRGEMDSHSGSFCGDRAGRIPLDPGPSQTAAG
jgi:hypothetical protein